MEALSVLLEPYTDLIVASVSTLKYCQQLSSLVICNDIRKRKTTSNISAMPFVGGTMMSALMLHLGIILNDTTTVKVNFYSMLLNISYTCFFYIYTNDPKDKVTFFTQIGYAVAFLAGVVTYTHIENPNNLPTRYGLLISIMLFYFIGYPLFGLKKIIHEKNAESIPTPIVLSCSISSFLWFLYGIATRRNVFIFQNGAIFVISITQLILVAIYPAKSAEPKKRVD